MKNLLLIIALISICFSVKGQETTTSPQKEKTQISELSGSIIIGKVRNLLKEPVPNATIKVYQKDGSYIKEGTTNEKGNYLFDELEPRFYKIEVSHPEYESKKAEVIVNAPEEEHKNNLNVKMAPIIILENEEQRALTENTAGENEAKPEARVIIPDELSLKKRGNKWLEKDIPEFSLKDIKGNTWTNKSISGKPTVINFWHAGCIPCIKEMPQLNKWLEEYPDANYFTCTWNSDEVARPIIERTPFLFHNLIDGQELFDKLGVKLTPTTFVLDKDGVIQLVVIGASEINQQRIIDKVRELGE